MKLGKLLKAVGLLAMIGGMLACMVAASAPAGQMNAVTALVGVGVGAAGFVAAIVGRFCD